jgi:ACR3 family arsenite efflux pump ArsB
MSLDRAINILVTITLIEMMVLLGLQVTFTELAQASKNWWLLARAAMANYVLFPAVSAQC